jgi:hypothetical protein
MRSDEVDVYVKEKLPAQFAEAMETVRGMMEEGAPGVREIISYGQPTWKGKKMVLTVSPSKSHLTVVFSRGADIEDSHGLLEGSGKTSKHLKVKTAADLDREAFRDYLAQVLILDA